jgi:hypothetical protein
VIFFNLGLRLFYSPVIKSSFIDDVAPPGKIKVMEQASSEVSMLLKSMEMERVIESFFPGKTLEDFLSQTRSEVEAKIGDV